MATHTYRSAADGRRVLVATPRQARRRRSSLDLHALQGEQGVLSALSLRTRLEVLIEEAIEALDALDATQADMEPDHDGEAVPGEGRAQPITLSPDRRTVVVHRPSARQMRAAYRGNGDPIPVNLRGLLGRAFA